MPVAFLGDDITDEDAFRVLGQRGLSVLVRSEHRETEAQAWLRPPRELIDFLLQWSNNISA
jgi:trehalose-phosphatase